MSLHIGPGRRSSWSPTTGRCWLHGACQQLLAERPGQPALEPVRRRAPLLDEFAVQLFIAERPQQVCRLVLRHADDGVGRRLRDGMTSPRAPASATRSPVSAARHCAADRSRARTGDCPSSRHGTASTGSRRSDGASSARRLRGVPEAAAAFSDAAAITAATTARSRPVGVTQGPEAARARALTPTASRRPATHSALDRDLIGW